MNSANGMIIAGAIFHTGDEHLEKSFDAAIKDLNDESNIPFSFIAVKKSNVELDCFKTAAIGKLDFMS